MTAWTGNVREFLDHGARFGVLAAPDGDGRPWQAVLWYDVLDEGILINSLVGRHWPALLRHAPIVSFTVADRYDYVILRGRAEVRAEGQQAQDEIQALARRYGGNPADFAGQPRVSFLIRPEHISTHGTVHA